jgi:hypothetical protein
VLRPGIIDSFPYHSGDSGNGLRVASVLVGNDDVCGTGLAFFIRVAALALVLLYQYLGSLGVCNTDLARVVPERL